MKKLISVILAAMLALLCIPAPTLAGINPNTNIKVDKKWTISFAVDINSKSINTKNIYIINEKTKKSVDIRLERQGTRNIIISPKNKYEYSTKYTLYVKNILSMKGKIQKQISIPFTTEGKPSAKAIGIEIKEIKSSSGDEFGEVNKGDYPSKVINENVGEVESVDLNALWNESNDKRENELKKDYIYNISGYTKDFSKTLNYFTDDEARSLLTKKNVTLTLTQAQAIQDVETYFKYLEANYGAYEYFGGSKAFNEAKESVLKVLSNKSSISYSDFASVLQNAMSFIRDGHFAINNVPIVNQKEVRYEYYRCDNQNFAKDEKGYYKLYDDAKWYVTAFSNKAVSMRPTLLSSGKIVYSPVFFAPVTQLETANQITLSNGTSTRIETLKWVPTSSFNGQNKDLGPDMIAEVSGIKYIPFRRPFFIDSNITAYQSAGSKLKNEQVIILDNRSNNGGGDRHQQAWFKTFTGETFDVREAMAYKVNKFSIINFANFGNRYTNDSSYLGQWRTVIDYGKWFSNDTKIIVLMDDKVGSSGENMMYMLRTLDNVIFVGSNTSGCTICGNIFDIYLPNSGMPVRSGMMLSFPEKVENIDGIGLEPDIWVDPNTSLETVLNMIEYYGINKTGK